MSWMTTTTAAEYAAVSEEHVRRACRAGRLEAVKVGRNWRTKPGWVDEWMEQGAAA